MKRVRLQIQMEIDVDTNVGCANIEHTIESALMHSTATEAIQEALFNTYGEDVHMVCWWVVYE